MPVTVEILINGSQVESVNNVPSQPGMNVQQAMEAAYIANPSLQSVLRFDARFFGPMGYELMMLNGISVQSGADKTTFLFWELLVDGVEPSRGIDETPVQDGDVVTWNYIRYGSEKHDGTRREEIHKILVSS
jgi:hypothetical protein